MGVINLDSQSPRHSVSVAGIVVDDHGRALLIRRRDNHRWEPPGGILELAESIHDGLRREVREETGLDIEPIALSGVSKNMTRASLTRQRNWCCTVPSSSPHNCPARGRRVKAALRASHAMASPALTRPPLPRILAPTTKTEKSRKASHPAASKRQPPRWPMQHRYPV